MRRIAITRQRMEYRRHLLTQKILMLRILLDIALAVISFLKQESFTYLIWAAIAVLDIIGFIHGRRE